MAGQVIAALRPLLVAGLLALANGSQSAEGLGSLSINARAISQQSPALGTLMEKLGLRSKVDEAESEEQEEEVKKRPRQMRAEKRERLAEDDEDSRVAEDGERLEEQYYGKAEEHDHQDDEDEHDADDHNEDTDRRDEVAEEDEAHNRRSVRERQRSQAPLESDLLESSAYEDDSADSASRVSDEDNNDSSEPRREQANHRRVEEEDEASMTRDDTTHTKRDARSDATMSDNSAGDKDHALKEQIKKDSRYRLDGANAYDMLQERQNKVSGHGLQPSNKAPTKAMFDGFTLFDPSLVQR